MLRRPLCVALVITVAAIILFYGHGRRGSERIYRGESKRLRCQVEEINGQGDKQNLTVCDVTDESGKAFASRVKLYFPDGPQGIKIGNILSVQGEIYSFQRPGNPGQFNEYQYYHSQNIQYKVFAKSLTIENQEYNPRKQWLHELRSRLFDTIMALLPQDKGGIVAAMLLGEKCALEEDVKELFQEGGIAHILAISGLHISFLGAGLFFFLRRFVMPMQAAAVCTGGVLLLYGEMTGFPVSATRAIIMMLCMLAARLLSRHYDRPNALALAALIQLWLQPMALFQAGFLLSYGTILGICLFVPDFSEAVSSGGFLWNVIGDSVGIFLVTLPVILYFYYEMSPYSALLNSVVLPLAGALLLMSIMGSVLAFISMGAGRFLSGTVYAILSYYQLAAGWVRELPLAVVITGPPGPIPILLYYALLALWKYGRGAGGKRGGSGSEEIAERGENREKQENHKRQINKKNQKSRWLLPLLACALLLFHMPYPSGRLRITSLDVGQGDCILIRTGEAVLLIDGGSSDVEEVGKYRISRFLKHEGIQKIDAVFFTHSDSDHTGGLLEMIQDRHYMNFNIGKIVLPDIRKQDEEYRKLESACRRSGIPVQKMGRGDREAYGELNLECLHPYYGYEWESENDYSLVLQLEYRGFTGLFTGDLERAGEEEILNQIQDVDYLKVGHHGSAGSSSWEFLEKVRPEVSVISAGENNRYGHPSGETLERLAKIGTRCLCTAESGAVTVDFEGGEIRVNTYK